MTWATFALCFGIFSTTNCQLQWLPLEIALVAPQNFYIPQSAFNGLRSAIVQFRSLIQIRRYSGYSYLTQTAIANCTRMITEGTTAVITMFYPEVSRGLLDMRSGIYLASANFILFLQTQCKSDETLMASANPCGVFDNTRPVAGVLLICPRNKRLQHFPAATDLFRHEILHALGFGTVNALRKSPVKCRDFLWNLDGSSQKIRSHYMDFQDKATVFARKHFNCPELPGVEAEDSRKMHLDEYVYGDELMTPHLSHHKNYFTFITASILEATTRDFFPWYKTNESMVEAESAEYWYGRNWGCEFAMRSCYDYIRSKSDGDTFPFCNEHDLQYLGHGKMTFKRVCFANRTHISSVATYCYARPKPNPTDHPSGLQARPLSEHFRSLHGTRLQYLYGAQYTMRFCPFVKQVQYSEVRDLPKNAKLLDCNSFKTRTLVDMDNRMQFTPYFLQDPRTGQFYSYPYL